MDAAREIVHATAVSLDGRAALIRGPSGSGKSDLALRCLALGHSALLPSPAHLVSDDQVVLTRHGSAILAEAPDTIRGKIEVRGLGILRVPSQGPGEVVLVADLVPGGAYQRLPEEGRSTWLLGLSIAAVQLAPFEVSAPIKLLLALSRAGHASGPR